MPTKYTKTRVPIYFWLPLNKVEENAFKQAVNLANLPFAFNHVAIMPDTHSGFGMPIGGILATEGVVIPNAVGVDIGCGMHAFRTNIPKSELEPYLNRILKDILREIPTGFLWYKHKQQHPIFNKAPDLYIVQKHLPRAMQQLGTLGGGNHFIEIQYEVPVENPHLKKQLLPKDLTDASEDEDNLNKSENQNLVWIMLHSGSRNLGRQIADYYYKIARSQLSKKSSTFLSKYPSVELAYFELGTKFGDEYWMAMQYAQEYARANRQAIADKIKQILRRYFPKMKVLEEYDIHHNYAEIETHYGKQVIVHRKGATRAAFGQIGIIPGSMASPSYIVVGMGNPLSFESSSHGAGRIMGRRQALRTISTQEVLKDLERHNVKIAKKNLRDIAEEARMVYKNIDEILSYQKDLVYIKHKLLPMGVVKG